jgi:hypothetical protein
MIAFDALVSHSSKDKTVADATCAALEAAGIRCWIAPRDVTPGHSYGEDLIDALDACRVMVLVFSSSSNASPQIAREVERCVSRGVTIVPLRIENVVPTKAMAYFVGSVHWLDALAPPLEQHLLKLVSAVTACLPLGPAPESEEQPIVQIAKPVPQSVATPVGANPQPDAITPVATPRASAQEQPRVHTAQTEPTPSSRLLDANMPQQHERIGLAYSIIGVLLLLQGLLQILCNAIIISVFRERSSALIAITITFILVGLTSIVVGIMWAFRAGLIISILCTLISLLSLLSTDNFRMFPSAFPYLLVLSVVVGIFSGVGLYVYARPKSLRGVLTPVSRE